MLFPARPFGAVFLALACTTAAAANADTGGGDGFMDRQNIWGRITDSQAWEGRGYWRGLVSPFTQHYRYNPEHRYVWAIGLERQCDDLWLAGASYFSNSFGQPSAYVYLGRRVEGLFGERELFFQWSAGVMYGYRGKYEHKVPLNFNGFSPGALVSVGWQFNRRSSVALHALGDAGVMLQYAYDIR